MLKAVPENSVSSDNSSCSYRYIDNGDGTVTDNRTGLIWLKNANYFGREDWRTALSLVANLADGECNLSDGSTPGCWRLPTRDEWKLMMDKRFTWPALSNATGLAKWREGDAFINVQSNWYWSSTTLAFASSYVWYLGLFRGEIRNAAKTTLRFIWPVRNKF
jgi:hypothetical protein